MLSPPLRSIFALALAAPAILAGGFSGYAHAATPPDRGPPAREPAPAKPMIKKEPMAGEMKRDGMLKEDVSKAAKRWSDAMDEKMKQEKMR